jgi:hypothetical protein
MICHQGLGEGFSIFGTDIGSQGYVTSQGASIWGDTLSRAAATEQYTQMLQQGPPVRPSMDSNGSSGGPFGGEGLSGMPDNGRMCGLFMFRLCKTCCLFVLCHAWR